MLVLCLLLLVFELFVFVGFELLLCAGGQQRLQRAALRLLLLSAGLGLTVLEHIIAGRPIEPMPVPIPVPVGSSSCAGTGGGHAVALQGRGGGIGLCDCCWYCDL